MLELVFEPIVALMALVLEPLIFAVASLVEALVLLVSATLELLFTLVLFFIEVIVALVKRRKIGKPQRVRFTKFRENVDQRKQTRRIKRDAKRGRKPQDDSDT